MLGLGVRAEDLRFAQPTLGWPPGDPQRVPLPWISVGGLEIPFALLLDPLSSLLTLVVTGVGSLIHVYSLGYMAHDEDRVRYFSYLNLFTFFMLLLVLGGNLPLMFVGWEGVGLCSYLLIGFWFKKKSASDAGKKAFIVNRIGDAGLILGMILAFHSFGTLDLVDIANGAGKLVVRAAGPVRRHHRRLPAALRGRHRQERADPAPRLAARRDGGPDPGVGPDPRRDHGHRGRVHGGAAGSALPCVGHRVAGGGGDRRGHGLHGRDGRAGADGHQEGPGLLDREPARLHVPGGRQRRLRRGRLPPVHARLLQGPAVPGIRLGDPRDGRASRTSGRWAACSRRSRSRRARSRSARPPSRACRSCPGSTARKRSWPGPSARSHWARGSSASASSRPG